MTDPFMKWPLRIVAVAAAIIVSALSFSITYSVTAEIVGQAQFQPEDQEEIMRRIRELEATVDIPPNVRNEL